MSEKKKLSDMTLEEQAAYYQKKAAEVKAKMVKKANERYMLIGKIVCEVLDDIPENDADLKAYFTKVADGYKDTSDMNAETDENVEDVAPTPVATAERQYPGYQHNNGYNDRQ